MKVWDILQSPLRFWARPGRRRLFVGLTALTLGSGIGVSAAVFGLVARAAAIRRAVNETGADVRLSGLVPATTLEAPILARFRFTALLLTAVAVAALVLAIAGLYGAITTMVERRRQEIGIRIALGALPGAIVSLIARQGLLLTAAGIALGSAVGVTPAPTSISRVTPDYVGATPASPCGRGRPSSGRFHRRPRNARGPAGRDDAGGALGLDAVPCARPDAETCDAINRSGV